MYNHKILAPAVWRRLAARISVTPTGALPGSTVSEGLRDYVYERDEGLCVYCKSDSYLQYDHVIPISHGGPALPENIVLTCETCNSEKTNSFSINYLVIAFNHLILSGENIDWIDLIFTDPIEESVDELEGEDLTEEIECWICGILSSDELCCQDCQNEFETEFET